MKLAGVALFAVAAFIGTAAQAEDLAVKIGVMSDMSGLYADLGGPGSVVGRQIGGGGFQSRGARSEGGYRHRRHAEQARRRRKSGAAVV